MKKLFTLLLFVWSLTVRAQTIVTFGGGGSNGDGNPATTASINNPHFGVFDKYGNYYFSEGSGQKIRKIDTFGVITTIAGIGYSGYSGDGGPATAAELNYPEGVALDTAGNIYISDHMNFRVRKVDIITGIISTYAGSGVIGDDGDGGICTAAKVFPGDIIFDLNNSLFISDNTFHKIRRVTAGIISTYAGTGIYGFSGDGGPATAAQLYAPTDIALDKSGNLFIADGLNKRVRKIENTGIISTIAGNGTSTYNGDEIPATSAQLWPGGVAVDDSDNIYISDYSYRVRKIDAKGMIHTIAGTGVFGYSGDGGMATAAQVSSPGGISLDICGNMYFADAGNNRIRVVTQPMFYTKPTISLTSPSASKAGATVTVTATLVNAGSSYIIHWLNKGAEFATTTIPTVTYTKGTGIDTITARVVSTASYGCYDSTTSAPHIIAVPSIVSMTGVSDIYLYPNPATGVLHIDNLQTTADYRLLSMVGAVLQQGGLKEGSNVIDIAALPVGMYLVEVSNAAVGLRMMYKIVKQ